MKLSSLSPQFNALPFDPSHHSSLWPGEAVLEGHPDTWRSPAEENCSDSWGPTCDWLLPQTKSFSGTQLICGFAGDQWDESDFKSLSLYMCQYWNLSGLDFNVDSGISLIVYSSSHCFEFLLKQHFLLLFHLQRFLLNNLLKRVLLSVKSPWINFKF